MSLMAWRHWPSVKSFAYTETYASVAWVSASKPESAVTVGGRFIGSIGSMIATFGVSA